MVAKRGARFRRADPFERLSGLPFHFVVRIIHRFDERRNRRGGSRGNMTQRLRDLAAPSPTWRKPVSILKRLTQHSDNIFRRLDITPQNILTKEANGVAANL